MEGLTDPLMRQLLTQYGAFDWCVSEFIRVTSQLLPVHVIDGFCPERANNWQTAAGTPLHVQFLGSDPAAMADNAAQAAALGAPAIDLNFGCPAKTVNRHGGGAALLTEPDRIFAVVSAVRQAVPASIPVSAKMRLGYADDQLALTNAQAIAAAGASWLNVHARTKVDGYRPPAYWDRLAPLQDTLAIPVIANGEIWTPAQAAQCQQESGCQALMLGRGAVTRPDLSVRIRGRSAFPWSVLVEMQLAFLAAADVPAIRLLGRYKQWLGMLSGSYPQAAALWSQLKRQTDLAAVCHALRCSVDTSGSAAFTVQR